MERFWDKVYPEPNTGCWLWGAATSKFGYGVFRLDGRNVRSHRLAWEMANGSVPEGQYVLHKCDVPSCVNADHLFLGTYADNSGDCVRKGRYRNGNTRKTHCIRGHELTPDNVYVYNDKRHCRKCQRARSNTWKVRRDNRLTG